MFEIKRLSQLINSEKWYSQEIYRLTNEGWTVFERLRIALRERTNETVS